MALVALNLRDTGLFPDVPMPRWRKLMAAKHMYSEHWLLAYEAHEQGWLSSKTDYIAANPAFAILRKYGVQFYDSALTTPPSSATGCEDVDDMPGVKQRIVSGFPLRRSS